MDHTLWTCRLFLYGKQSLKFKTTQSRGIFIWTPCMLDFMSYYKDIFVDEIKVKENIIQFFSIHIFNIRIVTEICSL